MSLANCKQCGKLFIQARSPHCIDCEIKRETMYRQMREYVKGNPGSTVLEVHMNTGIPIATVLELQKSNFIPYS